MATRFRAHMNTINNMLRDCVNNMPTRTDLGLAERVEEEDTTMEEIEDDNGEQSVKRTTRRRGGLRRCSDDVGETMNSEDGDAGKRKRGRPRRNRKSDQVMCDLVDKGV